MKKETTIYDIAAELMLSPATVSRALKDHPAIRKETKELVRLKAEEMRYRSNLFASNLRRRKTNTLGVIVPRLNSNFMSSVLAGMERVANEAGYNLLITQSLESREKEHTNTRTMFNSRVDGLLVSIAYDTEDLGHFRKFVEKKIPLVFFDRVADYPECTRIVIDNSGAAYQATSHLISQGCRRLLHVTGNQRRNVYYDRHQGFLKALTDHQLSPDTAMRWEGDLSEAFGRDVALKVHETGDVRPDGVFIDNDLCAVSFIRAMRTLGHSIPRDVAVVGFNDDPLSQFIDPQLSTIRYPGELMGETAARKIISQIEGSGIRANPQETIFLPYKLIERASSLKQDITAPERHMAR